MMDELEFAAKGAIIFLISALILFGIAIGTWLC